jgi:hypothetical protein
VSYQVTVNHPARPEGDGIEIPGLGVFPNGKTVEISDEQAENYRHNTASFVDVPTDDRPAYSGAAGVEFRRGPDVLGAFKGHQFVTVERVKEKPKTTVTKAKEK